MIFSPFGTDRKSLSSKEFSKISTKKYVNIETATAKTVNIEECPISKIRDAAAPLKKAAVKGLINVFIISGKVPSVFTSTKYSAAKMKA